MRTLASIALLVAGASPAACAPHTGGRATPPAVVAEPGVARPPYTFSPEDAALLDDVQRGAFRFLWDECSPITGMVRDRTGATFASVAGVGFQLGAIPVAIERGWITRAQGEARTLTILRALDAEPTNRVRGMFFHFLEADTARPWLGYEVVASTVDSAILFAGALTASSYFGGEIAAVGDRLVADAQWPSFLQGDAVAPHERGFISLGWKADVSGAPNGPGSLLPFSWIDAGDEQRLVSFIALCPPDAARRVDPSLYYRLRRQIGEWGAGPMFWFPWSGALFTSFFAHCWIDYASMGADDPGAAGVERRPGIDWWESSRRSVLMHRARAIENPRALPTYGPDAWGLGASDGPSGYLVTGLFPRPLAQPGARAEFDEATFTPKDDWGDGTIAPYNAGCSVMFEPALAVRALRHYRGLRAQDGTPLVWREPASGGFGFRDSFNAGTGWVAPDGVAIDQGPLVLAIENARTGRVWRLFAAHRFVAGATRRLGLDMRR